MGSARKKRFAAAAGLSAIGLVVLFGLFPAALLGVDGKSLASSVGAAAGISKDGDCVTVPGGWRCRVEGEDGSGDSGHAIYRVTVDGHGCWRAHRIGRAGTDLDPPSRASGCIRLLEAFPG
jgi:hypothetical protein